MKGWRDMKREGWIWGGTAKVRNKEKGGVSPDEQIKRRKEKERRFSGRQRKAAQNEGLLLV